VEGEDVQVEGGEEEMRIAFWFSDEGEKGK
jgi:hypothetical protein